MRKGAMFIGLCVALVPVAIILLISVAGSQHPKSSSSHIARISPQTTPSTITPRGNDFWRSPSTYGFPDASNTGPREGTSFEIIDGDHTISRSGVYQDLWIKGKLTVTASNVTINNFKVTNSAGQHLVYVPYDAGIHNVVFEHCEIDGQESGTPGLAGSGYTLDACNIHGTGDGVDMGSDDVVTNSYIHNLVVPSGSHVDCIQSAGGHNYLVRHNTLDARGPNVNSAIIVGADLGPMNGTVIEGNLLAGGNYTIYAGSDGKYNSGDIRIDNNRLKRGTYKYGPYSFKPNGGELSLHDNVYDNDGQPVRS